MIDLDRMGQRKTKKKKKWRTHKVEYEMEKANEQQVATCEL